MDFGAVFYPLLLVCALFGVILVVGIGFSYLWLLALDALARTCPQCRKRGAGNVTASEVVDSRSFITWSQSRSLSGSRTGRPRQVRVTEKSYEDHYECRHCGHQWTKTAKETERTPVGP